MVQRIYRIPRVTKPGVPLSAYEDTHAFKLYILDTGLLGALSGLDVRTLLEGNRVFEEFKGVLGEQYVLRQLVSEHSIKPFYWSAERADAEVDFLFQSGSHVVPLEVKAAANLKAKSLRRYSEKYSPPVALRTSLSDYRKDSGLINVPLYALICIPEIIATNYG